MMNKVNRTLFSAALVLGLAFICCGCGAANGSAGSAVSGKVSTDGSTSMEKTIGSLGEAYMMKYPDVNFTFNPTGSGSGIVAVADGRCDIGLSSRKLSEEEKQRGLAETVLAYDGIAVVVNPDNPVGKISLEDLGDIYTGKIKNWKELGGEDAEIVVVGREAASGTRSCFEEVLNVKEKCRYRQELTSAGDVMTSVGQNPHAIGYTSFASLNDSVATVAVNGVVPSKDTIRNGHYEIQRPFILVTKANDPLSPTAKAFFDYITSADAVEIIESAGVIAAVKEGA